MLKALRGAITIAKNETEEIYQGTKELLQKIMVENKLTPEEIINVTFSATSDLTAAYPAKAARDMGWVNVPMFCVQEMEVEGSLVRCIRIMMLVNWEKSEAIKHIYLREAKELRPDLQHK